MLKKVLCIMVLLCLSVTLIWAVTGRTDSEGNGVIFSSSLLLKVLEESPTVSTDWIFAIEKAKDVDLTIRIPIYRFNPTNYDYLSDFTNEYYTINIFDKIWDITIDSVMGVSYAGTVVVQGITYAFYFLRYIFV